MVLLLAAARMLSSHEWRAFFLAPLAAPAAAALALRSDPQLGLTTVVAYIAAFVLGVPLFVVLRNRGHGLATRCLAAGVVSGAIAGASLVYASMRAFSASPFASDPHVAAELVGYGALWGVGLGLAAGMALLVLIRAAIPSRGSP